MGGGDECDQAPRMHGGFACVSTFLRFTPAPSFSFRSPLSLTAGTQMKCQPAISKVSATNSAFITITSGKLCSLRSHQELFEAETQPMEGKPKLSESEWAAELIWSHLGQKLVNARSRAFRVGQDWLFHLYPSLTTNGMNSKVGSRHRSICINGRKEKRNDADSRMRSFSWWQLLG